MPDCGYAETIDVVLEPLTPYVSHNAVDSQFAIERTDAEEFVGIYSVTI